jgi:hypothetical protein
MLAARYAVQPKAWLTAEQARLFETARAVPVRLHVFNMLKVCFF